MSRRLILWGAIGLGIFAAIWLLSPVLFPFLVGLAIAMRFALERYLDSPLYRGLAPAAPAPDKDDAL
jgi:hypothetical protein